MARSALCARRRRQKLGCRVEIFYKVCSDFGASLIGFAKISLVFAVVRNVAPHPPSFKVIVRGKEDCFSLDRVGIGSRYLSRAGRKNFFQEPERRIGAHNSFVRDAPLQIQIVLAFRCRPMQTLDVIDRGLVIICRAFVGVICSNIAPHPVTGGATPCTLRITKSIRAVKSAIGANERTLNASPVAE